MRLSQWWLFTPWYLWNFHYEQSICYIHIQSGKPRSGMHERDCFNGGVILQLLAMADIQDGEHHIEAPPAAQNFMQVFFLEILTKSYIGAPWRDWHPRWLTTTQLIKDGRQMSPPPWSEFWVFRCLIPAIHETHGTCHLLLWCPTEIWFGGERGLLPSQISIRTFFRSQIVH